MNAAVVGTGRMGTALAATLRRSGIEVCMVGRRPTVVDGPSAKVRQCDLRVACDFADLLFLAVPCRATLDLASGHDGALLAGKILVDLSNPHFDGDGAVPPGWASAGEAVAHAVPHAAVVKALNTVSAALIGLPVLAGTRVGVPIATDVDTARNAVAAVVATLGFAPLDAGGIVRSREMEALTVLLHSIGRRSGAGAEVGFHLTRSARYTPA